MTLFILGLFTGFIIGFLTCGVLTYCKTPMPKPDHQETLERIEAGYPLPKREVRE